MKQQDYYLVKKEGHQSIKCETKAAAYEGYDCFGKSGVTIEHHIFDFGKEYVHVATKVIKRTRKDGTISYRPHWNDSKGYYIVNGKIFYDKENTYDA